MLVDAKGRTLYLFEADKGPMSACGGACASVWPPLMTTGKPTAGPGVTASKLGTTKRSDGATEVTYNGHPLYTYAGDSAPARRAVRASTTTARSGTRSPPAAARSTTADAAKATSGAEGP